MSRTIIILHLIMPYRQHLITDGQTQPSDSTLTSNRNSNSYISNHHRFHCLRILSAQAGLLRMYHRKIRWICRHLPGRRSLKVRAGLLRMYHRKIRWTYRHLPGRRSLKVRAGLLRMFRKKMLWTYQVFLQ